MIRARRALAIAAGMLFVACGLSVEGIAPLATPSEGGIAETGTTSSGGDGRAPDATIDVHVPGPDCHDPIGCDAKAPANTCFFDGCNATAGWPEILYGGSVAAANGACTATIPNDASIALRYAQATAPEHYSYSLTFTLPAEPTGSVFPVAIVGFAGQETPSPQRAGVIVAAQQGKLALCEGDGKGGLTCTPSTIDVPAAGGFYRVSGEIDRRDKGTRIARLQLADSPTSCDEIVVRNLTNGAFTTTATALLGCSGEVCTTAWNNAVFAVTPLP